MSDLFDDEEEVENQVEQEDVFQITEEWPTWEMVRRLSVVGLILFTTLLASFLLSNLILL